MSEWIKCKDRLPELNSEGDWSDDVLVVMRRYDYPSKREGAYYEIMVGYYATDEGWYTFMHNNCAQVGVEKLPPYPRNGHIHRTTDEIVYWMPLPEPPKEEQE